jgi:hypothetical protein
MINTAILVEEARTIVANDGRQFNWGAVVAGAIAAIAVTFFLITLGSGVGLALGPATPSSKGAFAFLTLGAIYFLAAQAFGFTVGGYLVGRLIGPEIETSKEEEFRAAAHGMVMWAIVVVGSLLLLGLTSTAGTSAISSPRIAAQAPAGVSGYWLDVLFRPAVNGPQVAADKAEAGRILAMDMLKARGSNDSDSTRIARLVSQDTGLSMAAAMTRTADVQARMAQDARSTAEVARKAAATIGLWTALALLFGAIVAVASAISARWMDDKISFSLAPRR